MIPGKLLIPSTVRVDLLTGLISCWEFEETGGTTCYDSHGSNDLTISGATVNNYAGMLGSSIFTDGYNDYARIATSSNNLSPQAKHSISVWFKRIGNTTGGGSPGGGSLVSRYYPSTGLRIFYLSLADNDVTNPNRMTFSYYDTSNVATTLTYDPASDIWTGNWRHVALSRNGSGIALYVDGVCVATKSGGNGSMKQSTNSVCRDYVCAMAASNSNPDAFLYAYVTQVAVWNIALTQGQVSALYNSGEGLPYADW